MNLSKIIPTPVDIGRETLTVLAGMLLAAYIISRFPAIQAFVSANSLVLKDANGNAIRT